MTYVVLACAIMFTTATVHYGQTIHWAFLNYSDLRKLLGTLSLYAYYVNMNAASGATQSKRIHFSPPGRVYHVGSGSVCADALLLGVNVNAFPRHA